MPHYCKLSRSRVLRDSFSVTSTPLLDFLVPSLHSTKPSTSRDRRRSLHLGRRDGRFESFFFGALDQASVCKDHKEAVTKYGRQRRDASSTAAKRNAASLTHQRFDDKGRLLVETTAPLHPAFSYEEYTNHDFFDTKERRFAASSKLPPSFFTDVNFIRDLMQPDQAHKQESQEQHSNAEAGVSEHEQANMKERLELLESVRQLEEKLAKAKRDLARSISGAGTAATTTRPGSRKPAVLTKKDYLNLVDLYFYSHNSRFSPESTDESPTPIILNDYSFTLSADFTQGKEPEIVDDDENYESPLKEIEEQLKTNQLREIAVMRVFIDLLLDDRSPNRALYEAYQQLPQPGVSYLPQGVIRLLLQRMSTPWIKTPAAMLRYLSLIDDMQQAKLPINTAEWSSAIYLAGRSFHRLENDEVGRAFSIWRQMEEDAGVKSSSVTFNILFDVAVRNGKFALGETILTEMHKRNLRLNRMGRVSLMYYHGLRGDGDGVRKAYHDFVEAGEIVDTLVLNCVIASLVNAQEPTAAEQIYQRMKDMQATLREGWSDDGRQVLFKLHPEPGSNRIDNEMASNHLGRILNRAPHLRDKLPEHHERLQAQMPLTPNFTTFRIMLAHHSAVSGDLDRMTVLLQEMLGYFDIPLFPVIFQLLFKGFAIHGPRGGPDSTWSRERLDMTWDACRTAMKDSMRIRYEEQGQEVPERLLPSITDVNVGMSTVNQASDHGQPRERTLSMWQQLVVDLAAFPRERLKRIERYASTQFDDVPTDSFVSPFFQQTHYSAPQPELDDEEGEYTLPDPVKSRLVDSEHQNLNLYSDQGDDDAVLDWGSAQMDEEWDRPPSAPTEGLSHSAFSSFGSGQHDDPRAQHRLRPSKPLVCWLLRAYSRMTGSRAQVEEVWGSVRKIWHPKDEVEAEVVIKVLLRCLRDCDRYRGRG